MCLESESRVTGDDGDSGPRVLIPPGSSAQTAGGEAFLRRLAPEEQARPEEPRVMLSAEPFGTGIF